MNRGTSVAMIPCRECEREGEDASLRKGGEYPQNRLLTTPKQSNRGVGGYRTRELSRRCTPDTLTPSPHTSLAGHEVSPR